MEEEKEVTVKIPRELFNFIEKLVNQGLFKDTEDFVYHAIRLLSEFYGLTGESILNKIISQLGLGITKKVSDLSEKEQMILDAFGKSKFVYEDELYILTRKEAIVRRMPPMSREEFDESLEKLINRGILERIKHGNETLIRKREEE